MLICSDYKTNAAWFSFKCKHGAHGSRRYKLVIHFLRHTLSKTITTNLTIKRKSNHSFVERSPSLRSLTIIHHHSAEFLLLLPCLLPHFGSRACPKDSSNTKQSLSRIYWRVIYFWKTHFGGEFFALTPACSTSLLVATQPCESTFLPVSPASPLSNAKDFM